MTAARARFEREAKVVDGRSCCLAGTGATEVRNGSSGSVHFLLDVIGYFE